MLHVHLPPAMTGGGRLFSGESAGWGLVQGRVRVDVALLIVMSLFASAVWGVLFIAVMMKGGG